jgi:hypothetical protein
MSTARKFPLGTENYPSLVVALLSPIEPALICMTDDRCPTMMLEDFRPPFANHT